MADAYSLFTADEPTADEQAKALAAALRRQQTMGEVFADHPLLRQQGMGMLQQAQGGEQMLADAGRQRAASVLQKALAKENRAAEMEALRIREKGENDRLGIREKGDNERLGLQLGAAKQTSLAKAQADEADRIAKLEEGLRKELLNNPLAKATLDVSTAYRKVNGAAADPSAAGDLSLIYSYMRMLDPGSSVKEGEFASAQNAGGVPDRVRAQWNNALRGERLTASQRADFTKQAKSLFDAQVGQYRQVEGSYRNLTSSQGGNPERVAIPLGLDLDTAPNGTAAAPALSPEDAMAVQWAKQNKADPRAAEILRLHGVTP